MHHRVVPDLELQSRGLPKGLQELGLLFEQVERHLGVNPDGQLSLLLAKGDEVIPIRQGQTLDGTYRVESITDCAKPRLLLVTVVIWLFGT